MASLALGVIDWAIGKAIEKAPDIATFALDQALALFFAHKPDEKDEYKRDNNRMDKMVVYNKLQKRGISKYIDVQTAADQCLKQIENFQLVFETHDFGTALDYLSDAWRALSGDNIPLFKQSINKAFAQARTAKTKITQNANHLLGVYSIIIFCGFCKFSNFGENTVLGMKHIKDTLKEMSAGGKRESLINMTLIRALKAPTSNLEQQIFLKNAINFGMRVKALVINILVFANQNGHKHLQNAHNPNKVEFGNLMSLLFPRATTSKLESKKDLYDFESWTPNIFDQGRWFGAPMDHRIFEKDIDFFGKIYQIIYDGKNAEPLRVFIKAYRKQVVKYIAESPLVTKPIRKCIRSPVNNQQEAYLEVSILDGASEMIAMYLALLPDIQVFNAKAMANKNPQSQKKKPSRKTSNFWAPREEKNEGPLIHLIPKKVVIKGPYSNILNIALDSKDCGVDYLEFNATPEEDILKCLKDIASENDESVLNIITRFGVRNTKMSLVAFNEILQILADHGVKLKEVAFERLTLSSSYDDLKRFSDGFNLSSIPDTVETFIYQNIRYTQVAQTGLFVEADKQKEERMIARLTRLNMGSRRKIINAMQSVVDKTNIEEIKQYLMNNWYNDKHDDLLCKFMYTPNNSKPNLSKIDLTGTKFGEYNLRLLLCKFIGSECHNLKTLTLCGCGITNDFCPIFIDFYTNRPHHKLSVIKLENNSLIHDSKNAFKSLMIKQLIHRNDVRIIMAIVGHGTEVIGNLGGIPSNAIIIKPRQSATNVGLGVVGYSASADDEKYSQQTNSLPPGWRVSTTADGKVYYSNDITHKTQWDKPTNDQIEHPKEPEIEHPKEPEVEPGAQKEAEADTESNAELSLEPEIVDDVLSDDALADDKAYPILSPSAVSTDSLPIQSPRTSQKDELPQGWKRKITADGKVYYQNDITRKTQWEKPTATASSPQLTSLTSSSSSHEILPKGWIRCKTADGKVYYQNNITHKTQWNKPTV